MTEIRFIRNAETTSQAAGLWGGRADDRLSEQGETSLVTLGARLAHQRFDLVVSGPAHYARRTAESFSSEIEIDERLSILDWGRWQGWEVERLIAEEGDPLGRALQERDTPLGGTGETFNQASRRAQDAVDAIVDRIGEEGSAAVVIDGGLLQTLIRRYLPAATTPVESDAENASITRFVGDRDGQLRLATFNDAGHLGRLSSSVRHHLQNGIPVLALVRHGLSVANVEGRWQGATGDGPLDEVGYGQAEALAKWYGKRSVVYSSPLRRAYDTASYLASDQIETDLGLREIALGEWEGLNTEEVMSGWPNLARSIFDDGMDLNRGTTGETYHELRARFSDAIQSLVPAEDETTIVASHGEAIRAYISDLADGDAADGESLHPLPNTSVTHVALTDRGPRVLDFAVAAHLELES